MLPGSAPGPLRRLRTESFSRPPSLQPPPAPTGRTVSRVDAATSRVSAARREPLCFAARGYIFSLWKSAYYVLFLPLLVENIFLQLYVCRHHKFWGGVWGLLGAWKDGKQRRPKIGWCLLGRQKLGLWVPLKGVGISRVILCLMTPLRQNAARDNSHPKMYVDAPESSIQL